MCFSVSNPIYIEEYILLPFEFIFANTMVVQQMVLQFYAVSSMGFCLCTSRACT